jgi:hypothetical protein
MVVVIPPELEPKLRQAALQNGIAPEEFALQQLRKAVKPSESLFDAWQGFIGTIEGNGEANSERTSEHFAQAMLEKKQAGHL